MGTPRFSVEHVLAVRPLRIAFLTPEFVTEFPNEGGLATFLDRITQVLQDMGHEVEVFTRARHEPGVIDYYGVRVTRVVVSTPRAFRWLLRLSRLHRRLTLVETLSTLGGASRLSRALTKRDREKPFDLVHCSDHGLTSLFVEKRTGRSGLIRCSWARDLFTAVDGELWTLDNWLMIHLERLAIRRADVAYAPSRFLAEYMSQKYGIKLHVLRPPCYIQRQPVDLPSDLLPPRYLVHFGLLGRRKGTDLVAEALPRVWKEEPNFTMVWAGTEHTENIIERCRRLWGDRAGQVKWLGPIARPILYAVVKGADAAVLPSRCDNLPNTVIESLLLGVPVIGSRGASIDELIEPGICGELVAVGDTAALAGLMISVWRRESPWAGAGFRPPNITQEMDPYAAASNLLRLAGFCPPLAEVRAQRYPVNSSSDKAPVLASIGPCIISSSTAAHLRPLILHQLHPTSARAGQRFNAQPNGQSALSVACENALPGTIVVIDNTPLLTTYGASTWLTAIMPPELYSLAGDHQVYLMGENGVSNRVEFAVEP